MSAGSKLNEVLDRIDTETNNVAAVVHTLRGEIKEGMTAAEVATAQGKADAIEGRLKGIAADPTEPVPEPTPEFTRAMRSR